MKNSLKTNTLILFLLIAISFSSQAQTLRIGMTYPTVSKINNFEELIKQRLIDVDSIQFIGIFHVDDEKLIAKSKQYIKEKGYTNFSVVTIDKSVPLDSLFKENSWTEQFEQIFRETDGMIFTGGDDIPPSLYGEETFITTKLITKERNWELSFLYHLTGGNQNPEYIPFLDQNKEYPILGICLGMQEMNVASGGTLYQDIPYQVYNKKTYEEVLELNDNQQHKNYRKRLVNTNENNTWQFHQIKISNSGKMDFSGFKGEPRVYSSHHQSVKGLGKNYVISATSMDGKIIEGIENTIYPNVYAIQFHPENKAVYDLKKIKESDSNVKELSKDDLLFHKLFWKDYTNRFIKKEEKKPKLIKIRG